VCIEDLDQFGGIPYDSNPPYFSLDASCSISNIREVVSSIFFAILNSLVHCMIICNIVIFIYHFLTPSNEIIYVV
jgi:hypothetical protein